MMNLAFSKNRTGMKRLARIVLIGMILMSLAPLVVLGAGGGDPPEEPYEKVAAKQGNWYSSTINYDGKAQLIIGYKGSHETQAAGTQLSFSLKETTLITGIHIPFKGIENGEVTIAIADSRGNVYQGFTGIQEQTGGISEANSSAVSAGGYEGILSPPERNTLYAFVPYSQMILPKGQYTIYLSGEILPVDAYLIKGYQYGAYQRYLEDLEKWAIAQEGAVAVSVEPFGNEALSSNYNSFLEGNSEAGAPAWQESAGVYPAPVFTLEAESQVDEILLSTWNGGVGATPGIIRILNQNGDEVASYQAQGAYQGDGPNGMWVANPELILSAGTYTIDLDDPEVLDMDENGEPVFYVEISTPAEPPLSFTGTYRIWLDLYKTHTLMGPVNDTESSFSLQDYQLAVLDKGEVIELIGQYEGIPFSQNCTIIEREGNVATGVFDFSADLTNLPYKARIAANAQVTFVKEDNGRIAIAMDGQGFYSRAATKEKGADENTYTLGLRGNQVKKDLPPFVMAAIAGAYGAGNIPGPDSPYQVAVGMLFPPLVGLIVSVLQGLLRPKELTSKLSVGEEAMKNANQSLGKGLYTEEEAKAWATVADALGASGGDPEDGLSIGDNEVPGGGDSAGPEGSSFGGTEDYGEEEFGNDDNLFGKPDSTEEPAGEASSEIGRQVRQDTEPEQQPESEQQPEPEQWGEPESMVVQTSHRGAQTLIVRDPDTGQWINAETGNPFDLGDHQRKFPGQAKEFEDYLKRNQELEATGKTSMQQTLDEIERKQQNELAAIQKEIDQRWREQLERNQRSLEWEQEHARELSGWGRIIGDSVVNAGNDVTESAKIVAKEVKEGLEIAGETARMTARDLFINQKQALENIKQSYEEAKGTLESVKDKVVSTAEEIRNKPWIVVKAVMEKGKSAVDIVTDPKKALEWAKDTVGITDFGKSLDPNLTLVERMKHTFAGTMKLGVTIGTAGQAGAALKGAGGKLAGMVDDVMGIGGKKIMGKVPLPKGIKPSLPVTNGPNYARVGRPPNVAGVTKTSQKIIQNTADDFGVQIKARPTTATADKWIESGKAVPKKMDIKAKTLDKLDELLGGPKDSDGLVGYYKPKLPPKEVMRRLSPETQQEIVKKYIDRRREFTNLSDKMKKFELSGEYKVVDGRVINRDGKFITGDVDIYDVVNYDGTALRPGVKKQVLDHLTENKGFAVKKGGSNVLHEDVISWTKDGIEYSEKAREKLINAAMDESKGVTSYNPMAEPTAEKYVR